MLRFLSPDKFLPERCNFPAGIDCIDKAVITAADGSIQLALKNNIGYNINITDAPTGTDDCLNPTMQTVNGADVNATLGLAATIENNGQAAIVITCGTSLPTGRFKSDITVTYLNLETSLEHRATGNIRGRAT